MRWSGKINNVHQKAANNLDLPLDDSLKLYKGSYLDIHSGLQRQLQFVPRHWTEW